MAHSSYIEQPDAFLPVRWLEGRPDTFADLAFGLGARRCVGETFAVSSLAALLPALTTGRRQLPEELTARVSLR